MDLIHLDYSSSSQRNDESLSLSQSTNGNSSHPPSPRRPPRYTSAKRSKERSEVWEYFNDDEDQL